MWVPRLKPSSCALDCWPSLKRVSPLSLHLTDSPGLAGQPARELPSPPPPCLCLPSAVITNVITVVHSFYVRAGDPSPGPHTQAVVALPIVSPSPLFFCFLPDLQQRRGLFKAQQEEMGTLAMHRQRPLGLAVLGPAGRYIYRGAGFERLSSFSPGHAEAEQQART